MPYRHSHILLSAKLFENPVRILAHFHFLLYLFQSVLARRVYRLSVTVWPEIRFAHLSLSDIVFPFIALLNRLAAVASKLGRQ
jgi:hypothetical protein